MSSLSQFSGEVTRKGVVLEMYRTRENPRYSGSAICGDIIEEVLCPTCQKTHARLYRATRKPLGMLGCWVIFRWNNKTHVPDLSCPIAVFTLPKDAKPVSDEENATMWHRR